MATEIDLTCMSCCAQTCCPRAPSTLYVSWHMVTSASDDSDTATMIYNSGSGKWETSWDCHGGSIFFNVYCDSDQWFFDLISNGFNFALPVSPYGAGGATMDTCNPVYIRADISNVGGYDCDTLGNPCDCGSPDTFNSFSGVVTE